MLRSISGILSEILVATSKGTVDSSETKFDSK